MPLPLAVRDRLDAQLTPYRARYPGARWLEPESWHLTLLFLGSVAAARLGEVVGLVEGAAEGRGPFEVAIGRGGGHRSRRGSVAWVTIDGGAPDVIALADTLQARCPDDLTLGAPPKRTQSAHLTVARRVEEDLIAALRKHAHGPIEADWTADRMALYRSHLSPSGSMYETLHEAPFAAR